MGLFRVPATLVGPAGRENVELLVDSGATLVVVPQDLAARLGLAVHRQQPVIAAGGRREVWPVAEVRLVLNGQEITTPCFVAPGGPPLLGAVALESLFLAIDPVAKRLVPTDGFVGQRTRLSGTSNLMVPPGLAWLQESEVGRRWLTALPRLINECTEQWDLRLGRPFPYAYVALAMPAKLSDGTDVVLKVQFPDRESEHEAAALTYWNGQGAVRLLAHDPARHALLIERCIPGTPLSELEQDAALDVLTGLLPRLWKPAGPPFRTLAEEAAWWADGLRAQRDRAGRPFEGVLLDAAVDALRTLPASQGEQVLLHQDLHGDNVLRAQREPWLVIDPKPLTGEREFGVAPIIRAFEFGRERRHVAYRLDRLTAELGLDRERSRLWALAQTVAWAFGSDFLEEHVETARWLLEMGTR